MFCPNCGKELEEKSAFCPECGQKIDNANEGVAAEQPGMQMVQSRANDGKAGMMLGVVGAALAIFGCFLPFYSVSAFGFSESVSFIEGDDGKLLIAVVIVALVLSFIEKLRKVVILPAVAAAVIAFYDWSQASDATMGYGEFSIGAYAIVIGCLILVVAGIMNLVKKNK